MADLEGNIQFGAGTTTGFGGSSNNQQAPAAVQSDLADQNTLDEPVSVTLVIFLSESIH